MAFICGICQENFEPEVNNNEDQKDKISKVITSTRCGHLFHLECLYQPNTTNTNTNYNSSGPESDKFCPICTFPIISAELVQIFPFDDVKMSSKPGQQMPSIVLKNKEIQRLQEKLEQSEQSRVKGVQKLQFEVYQLSNENQKLRDELEDLRIKYHQLAPPTRFSSLPRNSSIGMNRVVSHEFQNMNLNPPEQQWSRSISMDVLESRNTRNLSTTNTNREIQYDIKVLDNTEGGLNIGDKVVWILDVSVYNGHVIWLGRINRILTAGIKFSEPIGDFKGDLGKHHLFSGDEVYDRLIPVKEIILADDYYAKY